MILRQLTNPEVLRLNRAAVCIAFSLLWLVASPLKLAAAQRVSTPPSAPQEMIGSVSGDDVSVTGAISFEKHSGQTTALLASGSDLTVRSGQAKIDLPGAGDIILCGPARLSIVKSGPATTVALNYGQLHLQLNATARIIVYTPLLIVTPQSIGGRDLDVTIGLDQKGQICITSASGAMRVEEQFTSENLIVPQGGDVQIDGGELRSLRSGSRNCSCELLVSQNMQKQIEFSVPAHAPKIQNVPPAPQPVNAPVYRIDMPPLTFNASSPTPPPGPNPEAMLIIRESLADPAISFHGAVKPAMPPPPLELAPPAARSHSRLHFFARLFGIFHHHRASAGEERASVRQDQLP